MNANTRRPYAPLLTYLEAVDPEQASIALSFADLEQLTAHPLPRSAQFQQYWQFSSVARLNWQMIGWSARVDRYARTVLFTRRSAELLATVW